MVKYLFTFVLCALGINAISQQNFLDEIQLMDNYRNRQLIGNTLDSNLVKEQSFMIRSTFTFQNLFYQSSHKDKGFKIKSFLFSENRINNNYLPISSNDGNLIPAKGLQERTSIGLQLQWKALDINLQPEYLRGENLPQEVFKGNTIDGNWWVRYFYHVQNNIDDYRRLGIKSINEFDFGQTRIGLKYDQFAFGVSNENLWWGPGRKNSLVLTNNAAGFKHAYLQTNKPIKTRIGNFEAKLILGILEPTLFTHPDDSIMRTIWDGAITTKLQNNRNIQALTINWTPKWMPNFYIGYAFSKQSYIEDSLFKLTNLNPDDNKMSFGSIMFRYVLPRDHVEFYGEFGQPNQAPWPRNFFSDSIKTGFVFGARKLFLSKSGKSFFDLSVEVTQLQLMDPKQVFVEGTPFGPPKYTSWYTSPYIRQGYTHKGQLLGANIGPGSNSQSVSLSWNKGFNKIGVFFERLVHNSDFYHYAYLTGLLGYSRADAYWVDLNGGIEVQFMPYKNILIGGTYNNTNAMNYRWVKNVNDISVDKFADPGIDSDKYNSQFSFSIKFLFNGTR
jgi:hypothetical protein